MITAEEAKAYTKEFKPVVSDIREIEDAIKRGERHIRLYTTNYMRTYAEDLAQYCRDLGYKNARIEDIYSRGGARGGNYLAIDL